MKDARYNLIAINERSGNITVIFDETMTLDEAHTARRKFTPHRDVRIQVVEMDGNGKAILGQGLR